MFKLIDCEDMIRIPPDKFGQPLDEVAAELLKLKYVGTVDEELGYIVAVSNIKVDPVGRIMMGDGATYHKVTFTFLTFVPMLHEIVEGEVVEVENFGAFVRVGPADCLLHISQIIDDVVVYDEKQGALLGKETQRILKGGDRVRARITAVSIGRGGTGGKIGLTTRQPFLGKLEWIEEDVRKIREAEAKLAVKMAEAKKAKEK